MLISDQVLLVHLLLQLAHLGLKLLVLALDFYEFHFRLTRLALHNFVGRVNAGVLLVIVDDERFHVEALVHGFSSFALLLPFERVVLREFMRVILCV